MRFENDYWHAADKQAAQNIEVKPAYIGVSTHPAKDQLQELKSKIFSGASRVELGFFGIGKGAKGRGETPGMYGKEEREAMRTLAKVNEVPLTTHASANVMGFAGYAEGNFRDDISESAIHEVERAIDFAADTAGGGPVVIHTSEFPRPVVEVGKEFEAYPREKEKAPIYIVDDRTGKIEGLPREHEITVYKKDEKGNPVYDEQGNVIWESRKIADIEREAIKEKKPVVEYIYGNLMRKNVDLNEAEMRRWGHAAKESERVREYYEKLNELVSNAKNKRYAADMLIQSLGGARLDPHEQRKITENPNEFLKEKIKDVDEQAKFYRDAALSHERQVRSLKEDIKHIKPVNEYGLKRSSETIARAGITAWETEKARNLKKPLFIAPENIFPEGGYGSHPQELKNIIQKSREVMADNLIKEKKLSKSEAKKIANEHIKATYDIGHAYTWKKFFKGTEEEFNSWMKKQVGELQKEGIIGHVHLSDNFGYYDEHVTPGSGKIPFKELIKELKEKGYDEPMIVEAGAQAEGRQHEAMLGAWRTANSPIYRVDGSSVAWTDVEGSYFGRTGSPTYVVGDYAPSKDWVLFSGVPLE